MTGGNYRIRTGVQGFADLCLTTRPSRPQIEIFKDTHPNFID